MGTRYVSFGLPEPWGSIVRDQAAKRQMTPAEFLVHCVQVVVPETKVQHAAKRPITATVSIDNTIKCVFFGAETCVINAVMADGLVRSLHHVLTKGGVDAQTYVGLNGEPSAIRVARCGGGLSLALGDVKLTMSLSQAQEIAHDLEAITPDELQHKQNNNITSQMSENAESGVRTDKNPNFGMFA